MRVDQELSGPPRMFLVPGIDARACRDRSKIFGQPFFWYLQACGGHEIGFESPMLIRQVEQECSFTMDATYQSLKLRYWGFGVGADFQSLPKPEGWITNEFVSACLCVFQQFRKDVFFIGLLCMYIYI